ncbi:hypothetical protein BGZ65_012831 [Modicella reniformis]|uniref:CBM21 domain-containing protein n=1 Tax=Modicella reniformis TaxID=1440133 RepID=A0A9P6J343_9FUNG|nr:hypothetical protein BGZ65_012831 [Modicella reniformis]
MDQISAASILSEPSTAPQNCQIANTPRHTTISTLASYNQQDLIPPPLQPRFVTPTTPAYDAQSAERSSPPVATATVAQSDLSVSLTNIRRFSAQFHKNGLPIKSAMKSPNVAAVDSKISSPALCKPSPIRSQSLPLKPPKYVHFNTQLEHVRLFLQGEMSSCVAERETIVDVRQYDRPTSDIKLTLPNWSPASIDTFHSDNIDSGAAPMRVEGVVLSEDMLELEGKILVQNIAFHKHVSVRYTVDFWQTQLEVSAEFEESAHGSVDRFSFVIPLNMDFSLVEKTFCMAVRYQVNGSEFWDSNNGMNYHVECKRVVVAPPTASDITKRMNGLLLGLTLPDYSKPVLKKKQGNRYDFSTSLSAVPSQPIVIPTKSPNATPASQTAYRASEYIMPSPPSQNHHHSLYASSPKFINSYLSAASPPEHFHLGYDSLSMDRVIVNKRSTRDSWNVEIDASSAIANRTPSFPAGLYGSYSSSPKESAPISIPSPKVQMTKRPPVGSSSYFDLVERYCFYEPSPNISPYNSYSNSPPVPCIRV